MRRFIIASVVAAVGLTGLPATAADLSDAATDLDTRRPGWGVGLDYDLEAVRQAQKSAAEAMPAPDPDLAAYYADRPLHAWHAQTPAAERVEIHVTEDQLPEMQERLREYLSLRAQTMAAATSAVGQPVVIKIPTVLFKTNDTPFQPGTTVEKFENLLGDDESRGTNPTGTVTEMYLEQSYGNMVVDFDVYGPYEISASNTPATNCMYGNTGWSAPAAPPAGLPGGLGVKGLAREVVPQATPDIDFGQYDNDLDGQVDFLMIVHSGTDGSGSGDPCDIWSHYWGPLGGVQTVPDSSPVAGGNAVVADFTPTGDINAEGEPVVIGTAMTVPEVDLAIGVVAHEFMHGLGEPDYYDTGTALPAGVGLGDWDLGAGGSWLGIPTQSNPLHFNPYMKVNMGWVEPRVVDATTLNVELQPRGVSPDVVLVPLLTVPPGHAQNATCDRAPVGVPHQNVNWRDEAGNCIVEGFLLEHVNRSAAVTDAASCTFEPVDFDRQVYASGLAVWHFDQRAYAVGGNNGQSRTQFMVDIEEFDRRDAQQDLQLGITRGDALDLFWGDPVGISNATQRMGTASTVQTAQGPSGTRDNARATNGWSFTDITPNGYRGFAHAGERPGAVMTLDMVKHDETTVDVSGDFLRVQQPAGQTMTLPVIARQPITLMTPVYEHGGAPVTGATVALYTKDPATGGLPVQTKTVDLTGYGRQEVTFSYTPLAGVNELWVKTTAPGDMIAGNDVVRTELFASAHGPADVLIVDNDRNMTQEEDVQALLQGLGVSHHTVTGEPSAATMSNYDAVIWLTTTVSGGQGVLSDAARTQLQTYLNPTTVGATGGKVWFTSTRALTYHSLAAQQTFFPRYFGLAITNNMKDSWGTAIGKGDAVIGGSRTFDLNYIDQRPYLDYGTMAPPTTVLGTATGLFSHSAKPSNFIAARVQGNAANKNFQTVYSFPISLVEDGAERVQLTREVLNWFGVPLGTAAAPTGASIKMNRFRHVQPGTEWPVVVGAVAAIGIAKVDLVYRVYGDSTWQRLTLTPRGDGIYDGAIPASAVSNNGLEYYAELQYTTGGTVGGARRLMPDVASAGYGPNASVKYGACAF